MGFLKEWLQYIKDIFEENSWVSPTIIFFIAGGLFKMMFSQFWPVKIATQGKIVATPLPIYSYHTKPYIQFSIDMKVKSRVNDNVDSFYLELKSVQETKISFPITEQVELR